MTKIPLLYCSYSAIVDDQDYLFLSRYDWYLLETHGNRYARTVINGKHFLMHHLLCPSPSKDITPDHKDGNGLNNRKENLRLATKSQQEANKGKIFKTCSSDHKGVSYVKKTGNWRAYIKLKGVQFNLGYFKSENDAAKAYNEAATKHFGEFAKINEVNCGS